MRIKLAIVFLIGLGMAIGAETTYRVWPSQSPADCPFEPSSSLVGIAFTGRHIRYANADTWYPVLGRQREHVFPLDGWQAWAASGPVPWQKGDHRLCHHRWRRPAASWKSSMWVLIRRPAPYEGRYPCGSLVYNGVWYYGTYCLLDSDHDPGKGLELGYPGAVRGISLLAGLRQDVARHAAHAGQPLVWRAGRPGGKVKMGSPHFVDFGKNMQYSPDGKAYLVGHGATDPDPKPRPANLSWITGDQIYGPRQAQYSKHE